MEHRQTPIENLILLMSIKKLSTIYILAINPFTKKIMTQRNFVCLCFFMKQTLQGSSKQIENILNLKKYGFWEIYFP